MPTYFIGMHLRAVLCVLQVIEAKGRSKRNAVVVTELPYQVNKSALLQRMAEMVNDKKVGAGWDAGVRV